MGKRKQDLRIRREERRAEDARFWRRIGFDPKRVFANTYRVSGGSYVIYVF